MLTTDLKMTISCKHLKRASNKKNIYNLLNVRGLINKNEWFRVKTYWTLMIAHNVRQMLFVKASAVTYLLYVLQTLSLESLYSSYPTSENEQRQSPIETNLTAYKKSFLLIHSACTYIFLTLREGELSSSEATISWVGRSGFHCKTEHRLLIESEKLQRQEHKRSANRRTMRQYSGAQCTTLQLNVHSSTTYLITGFCLFRSHTTEVTIDCC